MSRRVLRPLLIAVTSGAALLAALARPLPAAAAGPPVVAVFDIEDASGTSRLPKEVALQLGDYLEGQLAEGGRFRLVPKDQIREQLVGAKKKSYEGCFDDACQIEIGKALAAQKTLSTKLMRIGKQCILKSVLFDLKNEVSDSVANVKGGCSQDDLVASVERVAEKLKMAVDPHTPLPVASPSPSPKANPILESLKLPETLGEPRVVRDARGIPRLTLRELGSVTGTEIACASAQACYDIGADHQNGRNGRKKDDLLALDHFRRACQSGYLTACVDVGYHIEMGRGTSVDLTNAAAYYQKGCDGGNQIGCANLAYMFENARGVEQSFPIAITLYGSACSSGNGRACTSLGYIHEKGNGVTANPTRAAGLYKQGCDGGNMVGCANYAYMLSNARGVEKDDGGAFAYYKKACDGDEARGCTDMGFMYENGRGVPFDLAKALQQYEQGCTMGNAFGCERAGNMYEYGRGVAKDVGRARQQYEKACNGGEQRGCQGLQRVR